MKNKPNLKLWVQDELLPFRPDPRIVIGADHYPGAQAAWVAWTIPSEMVCALVKTNTDSRTLTLCMCDLAAVALAILKADDFDDLAAFQQGLRLARKWARTGYEADFDELDWAIKKLHAIFKPLRAPLNIRYAAYAITRAVRTAEGRGAALEIPFVVQKAILLSLRWDIDGRLVQNRLLAGLDNDKLSEDSIRLWQCKRIRKHFPDRPAFRPTTTTHPTFHLFGTPLPAGILY